MTKFDEERRAADIRYAKARRAVLGMSTDAAPADIQAALKELDEAHREASRFARQAGADAIREDEGQPA